MTGRRKYGEGCAIAHALDLVGERWALLVVRELLLGPKRFTDLRAGLRGASADALTDRLRDLEAIGVVVRRQLPPPAAARVYELTPWGAELEPVLTHLGRWGSRSSTLDHDAAMSPDSLVLSLRALFDPVAARGESDMTIMLWLGGRPFVVMVADGRLTLAAGEADDPDATLEADVPTLAALLYGGVALADAVAAGGVRVVGQAASLERFLGLFPLLDPSPTSRARRHERSGLAQHGVNEAFRGRVVSRPRSV